MENFNEILAYVQQNFTLFALRFIGAIATYIIGKWLSRKISNSMSKLLINKEVDQTLVDFLKKIVYFGLLIITILAALTQMGIETTSFVAIIGAAGLAVGLALQGSLSNFAAGVLLIILRPFKVGDFIEAAGVAGKVEGISILTTNLATPQNEAVVIPNSAITSGNIKNYSAKEMRRVDMVFGIGYDDDIKKAKDILNDLIAKDSRVLKDPAPKIALSELADSSVNFVCRPWVKSADYWDLYFDMHEAVKTRFDDEGISIPFPQRDVHMYQHSSNGKAE